MSSNIWEILLPVLSGFVSGIAGYIGGRRQREKDLESKTVENLDAAFTVYKKIIDDLDARINQTSEEMKNLATHYEEELEKLRKQYATEIAKLKERISNQDLYIRELEQKLKLV